MSDEIKNSMVETLEFTERIMAENQELKDEKWKDEELQKMKEQMDAAREEMYRGFPISEKESEAIKEWEEKHWEEQHNAKTLTQRLSKMGAIGGSFYYKFIPTSIGTVGSICCNACMAKAYRNCGNNSNRLSELIKEYDAEFDFQTL